MLRAIIKIVFLPVTVPARIVMRVFRPKRIVRRLLKKRSLIAMGALAAAAAHQHSQKD